MKEPPCLFSKSSGLRVVWGVTGECSLKCKHCAVEIKSKEGDFPLGRYERVLGDMKKCGVDDLYISGGEPLLWEGIFDFVKHAKDNNITTTLGTNAMNLSQATVKNLSQAGIDKVFVSLDHYQEQKHNFLRGGDIFDKATRGLELLADYGVPARIDTLIWKENYLHLREHLDFCKNLAGEIVFAWPVRLGNAAKNADILPPEERYLEIGKELGRLKEEYSGSLKINYHRFGKFGNSCRDCNGGKEIFYLDKEGHISPCFWIYAVFPEYSTKTSVFGSGFAETKNGKPIEDFTKEKVRRYSLHGPGCPALCSIYNGRFHSKDPLLK